MKIQKITIKRFRGIKDQTIDNISNSLVLIGKNNSGKSAFLTAIRLFFGDYAPKEKDFYKNSNHFEIEVQLEISDDYLLDSFLDKKLGFTKIPSSANEFNGIKDGTVFADITFNDFKAERNSIAEELYEDVSTKERFESIWIKALKSKFSIADGILSIKLTCSKEDLKVTYEIDGVVNKDISSLFPNVAFIDDTRYFEEEETGKARTITSNLFSQVLKAQSLSIGGSISCDKCNRTDCDIHCINEIRQKSPMDLTIEDLQKLINYKTHNSAESITRSITERFQNNYQNHFKINIKATSNIDKSFTITTKIYDPNLDAEIDLSNVGAGIRSIYILSLLQSFQAMNSKHTIFIIEEPELYLHPELQKAMANTLAQISNDCQIVFTTHSPIMLRAFCNSDIRKVKLNEEEYFSIVEPTTIDDILNEIGYSSQDILNADFIVFVEGETDKTIYGLLLQKYYNIDIDRVLIIDTKSCNNIGFYATLRFLRRTTISSNFAILRDLDTQTTNSINQTLSNQLTSNIGADFIPIATPNTFITKYSSIEGYLLSPELLVSHGHFNSTLDVFNLLKERLESSKDGNIAYFRKHNNSEDNRINEFISVYDTKISDLEENIEWVKTNIQGHLYFNALQSKRIPYEVYISELPKESFSDILEFFDNIAYFSDKIIHY